jgi:MFS superfamily sulfate permease-like transporter
VFGILQGLLVAVTFSLVLLMQRISFPRFSVLGRLPGTHTFVSMADHPNAEPVPGLLIVRPAGMVFFANANRMRLAVLDYVRQTMPKPACVIIDNEMVPDLDMTSVDALSMLFESLRADGIVLRVARVREPVWEMLKRTGLAARIGRENLFWTMSDAADAPLPARPTDGSEGARA